MNLTSRPLHVFLCHSSDDKPTVRELYQKLSAEGWIDVWLDEEKLLPGQDWEYEIEKALDHSDAVIVTLSKGSVSKEGYVQKELRFVLDIALEKPEGTIFILPVRLEDCERPRRLRSIHGVDYFPESQRIWAYQRLLKSLRTRATNLNLSIQASEQIETPQMLSSAASYSAKSPRPIPSVATASIATKSRSFWSFGRGLVIFLLVLGFFGLRLLLYGSTLSDAEMNTLNSVVLLMYLAVFALILVTLARLFPWRHKDNTTIVNLERLVSGIGAIYFTIPFLYVNPTWGEVSWGFWLSLVGFYLSSAIILFEIRSTLDKGQKLPRWANLLTISILISWLVFLLRFIYLNS